MHALRCDHRIWQMLRHTSTQIYSEPFCVPKHKKQSLVNIRFLCYNQQKGSVEMLHIYETK